MKTLLLQDSPSSMPGGVVGYVLGSTLVVLLYFLPAILGRHKRQATPLLALNFLLGWTGLGWIAALIWALSEDTPARVIAVPQPAATTPLASPVAQVSVTDELEKLVRLRDAGALTEAEFAEQKARVLGATPAPAPAVVAPVPASIQMAQLRHRHHRGEISLDELNEQLTKLSTRPA